MKQSNGLKPGMVIRRGEEEAILIVSSTSYKWIRSMANAIPGDMVFDKDNLTSTWDYRGNWWSLDEDSIVDQILNKYQ